MPAVLDSDTIGTWEIQVNGGRWVWEINPDGTLSFHSEAPKSTTPCGSSRRSGTGRCRATNGYGDGGVHGSATRQLLIMNRAYRGRAG